MVEPSYLEVTGSQSRARKGSGHHRLFLGWDRPVLQSVADRLVESTGTEGPLDLSGHLVVLPGSRAGRRLRELLLERVERAERPLRPPRITTVGRLPEALYRPELPEPDPVLERLVWRAALDDLTGSVRRTLLPDRLGREAGIGSSDGSAARTALVDTIRALHRDVGAVGKDFSEVAALCRRASSFNDEARWTVLAEVQQRFRERLASEGFRDRESNRRRALREGELRCPGTIWIAGAPDLPEITRDFLRAAERSMSLRILVGAPEEMAERFDSWGCVRPDAWQEARARVPDHALRVVSGPVDQADATVAYLASLAERRTAEDVTIGVPDAEVVPYLTERLEEHDIDARDAAGRPLERTSMYRMLDALARFLEHGEFRDLATLIRHPLLETAVRAQMPSAPLSLSPFFDRYQARHLQARIGDGDFPLGTGRDRRDGEVVKGAHAALFSLLGRVRGSRPLAGWAPWIGGFLVSVLDSASRPHTPDDERQLDEVSKRVGRVLDRFRGLPGSIDAAVPAHLALGTLLEELREESVPPGADQDAIELLGWLELALDDAPVMVLTGMNEPHVPESTTAHAFLPHTLRSALGLLDNHVRWARDLLALRTILETRADTVMIAGRQDVAGNPIRLSRLLLAERPAVVARRLLSFLEGGVAEPPESSEALPGGVDRGDRVGRDAGPAADPEQWGEERDERDEQEGGAAQQAGTHHAFSLPPEPVLSAAAPPDSLSVTAFGALLRDPHRYALERILRLERIDDRGRELDGRGFGTLAHLVLQRFGATLVDPEAEGPLEAGAVRARLHRELERETRARFGSHPLPAVRIQIEQLRARLDAFADWQVAWARDGWRVRAVEASPEDGVPFHVDGEAIRLTGSIDRLDENPTTGEWCIFDYKTGNDVDPPEASHRAGRGTHRRWIDLQLPLYRLLAGGLRDGHDPSRPRVPTDALKQVQLGYLALPRDLAAVGPMLAHWSMEELDEAEEVARAVVRFLRENRFEYDRERSTIGPGDDLAHVVGKGVLGTGDGREADADFE